LHAQSVDFTLAWRHLADAVTGDGSVLRALFSDAAALQVWLTRWRERWAREGEMPPAERAARMRLASPRIIPRNHRVEDAVNAAMHDDDLVPFEHLLAAVRRPFDDDRLLAAYAEPAPPEVTACFRTFCGT